METPEKKSGSQLPIATGALVLVMLGAFGVSTKMLSDARVDSDARLAEAAAYLMEQPYLKVHPRLEAFTGADEIDRQRSDFWMVRERRGAPSISNGMRSRRQQILDEKVARSFEALDALPDRVWGLRPSRPSGPSFLTHAFIHSRFLHLATNVLIFCWLGMLLESVWGSATLLGFALCSAVVSGGVFVWTNPILDASLIGFSGVAAASLGAYAINAGNESRGLRYMLTVTVVGALLVIPSLMGQEWSLAPISSGAEFGSSQWSVLGGAIFGMVTAPIIWLVTLDTTRAASGLTKRDVAAKGLLDRARKAADNDEKKVSITLFKQVVQQNPTDRGVALEAWLMACMLGLEKNAIGMMLTAIRDELRSGEPETAVQHWLELLEVDPDVQAEPGLLVRLAPLLRDMGCTDVAVCALENALEVVDPAVAPEIASSVALVARGFNPGLARRAAQQALEFVHLDPERRSTLELLLTRLPEFVEAIGSEPVDESYEDLSFDAFDDRERALPEVEIVDTPGEVMPVVESPRLEKQSSDEMWELPEPSDVNEGSFEGGVDEAPNARAMQLPLAAAGFEADDDEIAGESSGDVEDLTDILSSNERPVVIENEPAVQSASQGFAASRKPDIELDVVEVVPVKITPDHLNVEVAGKGKRAIDLHQVDAIATAIVSGLAPTPIVIIDLALNWRAGGTETLRITRIRSDTFDACQLMGVERSVEDAVREMLRHLLAVANPITLPDPMSACGLPFAEFGDVEEYERCVLNREEGEELELL